MARFTKNAIMDAFAAEIAERPLEKITVTDIVKACGINRNTFYYYFHDIYALAAEVLERGFSRIIGETEELIGAGDVFRILTDFAQRNRRLVYHIYHSDHMLLEQQLFLTAQRCIEARIRAQAKDIDCTERDLEQLSAFYAYAVTGSFLGWLNRGMRDPLSRYIEEISDLLDGSARAILLHREQMTASEKAG